MYNKTIGILVALVIICLIATLYVYGHPAYPELIKSIFSSSFTGFSSALLLALKSCSNSNCGSDKDAKPKE